MPTPYQLISGAIDDGQVIVFKYQGDVAADNTRKAIPYVLGESDVPNSNPAAVEKTVLCYQFEGKGLSEPPPSPKNWRCFKVDDIQAGLVIEDFAGGFAPPKMTGKDRNRQNCVQEIDNFRRPNA